VVPEGRTLLRLPARAAFGIGSHESTSLALELIETLDLTSRDVLDAGTGTGVLSFAALLAGARRAVGYDIDPASPFHARDNSRLNGLAPVLFAGLSGALRQSPRFDLALINIVPEQILPEMPGLVRLLRPGGELILSGILAERGRQVLDRMRGLGFVERDRRADARGRPVARRRRAALSLRRLPPGGGQDGAEQRGVRCLAQGSKPGMGSPQPRGRGHRGRDARPRPVSASSRGRVSGFAPAIPRASW